MHLKYLARFLPNRCLLCGLDAPYLRPICHPCGGDLPWLRQPCSQCALPFETGKSHSNGDALCGRCLHAPPAFDHCYSPFYYAPPLDFLISGFKYRSNLSKGKLLAELCTEFLRHCYRDQPWPESLIPVPLHWRRQLFRGYNQAEVLARHFSHALPPTLDLHSCRRVRTTAHQQGQSRHVRKRNLRDAFQLESGFAGRHVAVLDDVVTTGSTVGEISRLLRRAGAARIDIWTLARTLSPGN